MAQPETLQNLYKAYTETLTRHNNEFLDIYKSQTEEIGELKERLETEGLSEEEICESVHDRKVEHILVHAKIIQRNNAELERLFPDFFKEEA
jgi:hypothetical protein